MATQTKKGKAFEYACLNALKKRLQEQNKDINIDDSSAYNTAKGYYDNELSEIERVKYDRAAKTAVSLLLPLEPQIMNGEGILFLGINNDSAAIGEDGDVRDVLCIRNNSDWEIGLSCKHNHEALKHPRITADKDFGKHWIGYNCSEEFINEISIVIDKLVEYGRNKVRWSTLGDTLDDIHNKYYVPILQAYLTELEKICNTYSDAPAKLLSYFFGSKDFYKIITKESKKTTTLEGFNMHGSLNAVANGVRPVTKIATLKMPTRLIEARFKETDGSISNTTIILTFDSGWSISMRLHNKDSIAKPTSLAWNVELEGLPIGTYVNISPWEEL